MWRARSSRSSRLRPAEGSSSSRIFSSSERQQHGRRPITFLQAEGRPPTGVGGPVARAVRRIQDSPHPAPMLDFLAGATPEGTARPQQGSRGSGAVAADQQVLQHRHLGDTLAVLKGAARCPAAQSRAVSGPTRSPSNTMRPAFGGRSRDAVQDAGLARAVGPIKAPAVAALDRHGDVVQDLQPAKGGLRP